MLANSNNNNKNAFDLEDDKQFDMDALHRLVDEALKDGSGFSALFEKVVVNRAAVTGNEEGESLRAEKQQAKQLFKGLMLGFKDIARQLEEQKKTLQLQDAQIKQQGVMLATQNMMISSLVPQHVVPPQIPSAPQTSPALQHVVAPAAPQKKNADILKDAINAAPPRLYKSTAPADDLDLRANNEKEKDQKKKQEREQEQEQEQEYGSITWASKQLRDVAFTLKNMAQNNMLIRLGQTYDTRADIFDFINFAKQNQGSGGSRLEMDPHLQNSVVGYWANRTRVRRLIHAFKSEAERTRDTLKKNKSELARFNSGVTGIPQVEDIADSTLFDALYLRSVYRTLMDDATKKSTNNPQATALVQLQNLAIGNDEKEEYTAWARYVLSHYAWFENDVTGGRFVDPKTYFNTTAPKSAPPPPAAGSKRDAGTAGFSIQDEDDDIEDDDIEDIQQKGGKEEEEEEEEQDDEDYEEEQDDQDDQDEIDSLAQELQKSKQDQAEELLAKMQTGVPPSVEAVRKILDKFSSQEVLYAAREIFKKFTRAQAIAMQSSTTQKLPTSELLTLWYGSPPGKMTTNDFKQLARILLLNPQLTTQFRAF